MFSSSFFLFFPYSIIKNSVVCVCVRNERDPKLMRRSLTMRSKEEEESKARVQQRWSEQRWQWYVSMTYDMLYGWCFEIKSSRVVYIVLPLKIGSLYAIDKLPTKWEEKKKVKREEEKKKIPRTKANDTLCTRSSLLHKHNAQLTMKMKTTSTTSTTQRKVFVFFFPAAIWEINYEQRRIKKNRRPFVDTFWYFLRNAWNFLWNRGKERNFWSNGTTLIPRPLHIDAHPR